MYSGANATAAVYRFGAVPGSGFQGSRFWFVFQVLVPGSAQVLLDHLAWLRDDSKILSAGSSLANWSSAYSHLLTSLPPQTISRPVLPWRICEIHAKCIGFAAE